MSIDDKNRSVTDDETIIKRKLLIDGDGIGDDRRINIGLKQFVKWCSTDDETPDENLATKGRLKLQLFQSEQAGLKAHQVLKMHNFEVNNYENIFKKIDERVLEAQEKQVVCKSELMQAKKLRRNKCEYDSLAGVILSHADRLETLNKLSILQQEIDSLEGTRKDLEQKLEKRRKQFQVLLDAGQQLQQILDDDEASNHEISDEKVEPMEAD